MSNEKRQAELLDQYLEALAENPNAPIPQGLDVETANFARQLADLEHKLSPSIGASTQRRIWNAQFQEKTMIDARPYITETKPISRAFIAALVSIVLAGGILLYGINSGNTPSPNNHSGLAQGSETPTAAPTLIPTSTPMPLDLSVTPTLARDGEEPTMPPTIIPPDTTGTSTPIPIMDLPPTVVPPVGFEMTATPVPFDGDNEMPTAIPPMFTLPPYQSQAEAIGVDETKTNTLTADQYTYVYAYNAKAGDVLSFHLVSNQPATSMSYYVLARPQIGDTISNNQAGGGLGSNNGGGTGGGGGGGGGGGNGGSAPVQSELRTDVEFNIDSIVMISINNAANADMEYSFTIERREVPAINYGEPASLDLNTLGGDQIYTFTGSRGDVVTVTSTSAGTIDTMLWLETSVGDVLAEDDDSGVGLNAELYQVQLPADGEYRIRVRAVATVGILPVEISINKELPLPLDTTTPQNVNMTTKYPFAVYAIQTQAGDQFTLTADGMITDSLVGIEIVRDGETLGEMELLPTVSGGDPNMPTISTRSIEFTASADGEILVFINTAQLNTPYGAYEGSLGSITLTLSQE